MIILKPEVTHNLVNANLRFNVKNNIETEVFLATIRNLQQDSSDEGSSIDNEHFMGTWSDLSQQPVFIIQIILNFLNNSFSMAILVAIRVYHFSH